MSKLYSAFYLQHHTAASLRGAEINKFLERRWLATKQTQRENIIVNQEIASPSARNDMSLIERLLDDIFDRRIGDGDVVDG